MAQVAGLQAELRGVRASMGAAQQAADAVAQDASKHGAEFAIAVQTEPIVSVPVRVHRSGKRPGCLPANELPLDMCGQHRQLAYRTTRIAFLAALRGSLQPSDVRSVHLSTESVALYLLTASTAQVEP